MTSKTPITQLLIIYAIRTFALFSDWTSPRLSGVVAKYLFRIYFLSHQVFEGIISCIDAKENSVATTSAK